MTALLCPILQEAQLTDNNEFLAGGRIWFYQAGTDQQAYAYTTQSGDVAWSNPIILNSRGETGGTIWLANNQEYRIVVENKPYYGQVHGTVITEHDNIYGVPVSVEPNAWILFGGVPSTASSTSFTVANDYRDIFVQHRKLKLSHSGGTTVHSVASSAFASGITTVNVTGIIPPGIASVQYSFVTPESSPDRFVYLATDDIDVSDSVVADRLIIGGNASIGGSTTVDGLVVINDNLTLNGNASVTGTVNSVPASQLLGGVFAGTTTMPAKGSLTLSNGIIIQWGSGTTDSVTHLLTVNLTTTYTQNIWYIGATAYSNSTQYSATAFPNSNSQILIKTFTGTTSTGSVPVYWMTIGK